MVLLLDVPSDELSWLVLHPAGEYRSQLRRHLLPTFGPLVLDQITAPICGAGTRARCGADSPG